MHRRQFFATTLGAIGAALLRPWRAPAPTHVLWTAAGVERVCVWRAGDLHQMIVQIADLSGIDVNDWWESVEGALHE
jgi:hypothetical protein